MHHYIFAKVYNDMCLLEGHAKRKLFDLEGVEYQPTEYKKSNKPPVEGYEKYNGEVLKGVDKHFWLRAKFTTPKTEKSKYLILQTTTGLEGKLEGTTPQGLIYLNGEMVYGADPNHTEAYLDSNTEYEMHNYFYTGMNGGSESKLKMAVFEIDERIEKLYFDFFVAFEAARTFETNEREYVSLMSALDKACRFLDFRNPYSKEYFEGVEKAQKFIDEEIYNKLCSKDGKPIVHMVGHTHIDVEWLWTRQQTREKIQRSFATAKALMDKYPEYNFMLTQPELYRYLKEEAPEKYEELKELIKKGRWEVDGAMYVEADCNLSSGESLIRQILQGTAFFKKEFDKDCKLLYLPDVFGYSAALPQILKKCGIDYFITSKISWSDTNKMPKDVFIWKGIDGTEIFTTFITTQNYDKSCPSRTQYIGRLTASQLKGTDARLQQKDYTSRTLTTFGFGDGGGGPTKVMLESYKRLSKGLPGLPVAKMSTIKEYITETEKEFNLNCEQTGFTPRWNGELYLELHRGTYTSIAKIKRDNRKSELGLQTIEALSYADMLKGGKYDADGIYKKWTKVLHNQFHDIIPGSSIEQVYENTDKDYAEISEYIANTTNEKLDAIAKDLNSDEGILVYNPSSFNRKGQFIIDGKTFEYSEEIPAFGYKVITGEPTKNGVKVKGNIAENKFYKMQIDKAGRIISLFDKRANREVFKGLGNEIQIFEDYPVHYDNWEISMHYKQKPYDFSSDAEITPFTDGTSAGFIVKRKYQNSTIKQTIRLYTENDRIDFENDIDWHEHHHLVKASFPFDINANTATYDIQYGHVSRPAHDNTSWDEAKFEVCAHKWADISEGNYGVAVLNDCKYGYNAEGSTLKLTLLRCGTDPNPNADQGKHVFTYSLLPHANNLVNSNVIKSAYELNLPLIAKKVSKNSGNLDAEYSLVSVDNEAVVIETIKKAEADDSMIIRGYESKNSRANVNISVAKGFKKAYLCNMLEKEETALDFDGKTLNLVVKPFEIFTIKFVK